MILSDPTLSLNMLDTFPDPITLLDEEGKILWCNAAMCELTHSTPRNLVGTEFHKALNIEQQKIPNYSVIFKNLLEGKITKRFELTWKKPDGIISHCEIRVSEIKLMNTKKVLLFALRDISTLRAAETHIRQERDRLQQLLDIASVALVVLDSEGRIQFLNQYACDLLETSLSSSVGKNWFEEFISPEDRSRVKRAFDRYIVGGEDMESFENPIVTSSGKQKWIHWTNRIIRHKDGNVIGTLSSGSDVTEIRRVHQDLAHSEQQYRNLIEQLPHGVAITSLNATFQLVNAAMGEILNEERDNLRGKSISQYVDPKDIDFLAHQTRMRSEGITSTYELTINRKDGEKRSIRVSAAPTYNNEGELTGSVGIFEDITQIKHNELLRFEQEKEIELYGKLLRHDIRNDLGLIMSYAEAIQLLEGQMSQEANNFLESTLKTINRISVLLTGFGRPQELRHEDISDFIRDIAIEAEQTEVGMGIRVHEEGDGRPKVLVSSLLALVFMNLFRNAAQHAGIKPAVDVLISHNDNEVEITVTDNGPGVPIDIRDEIFVRGISSKEEGGGLGLYLCKEIIESRNGSIELCPQKKNEGASFRITLPLVE